MIINIDVIGQALRYKGSTKTLVGYTQEFIYFKFYLSDEWKNLTTFAQFTQNGASYNVYLDNNNQVMLPTEIEEGFCEIALQGNNGNVIAKTEILVLKITKNTINSDAKSTEITLSLYDQLVNRFDNAIGTVTTDTEIVDIRLGVDGVKYSTAGNAVREQIKNVNSEITNTTLSPFEVSASPTWEQGTILDNGLLANDTKMCRTKLMLAHTDEYIEYNGKKADSNNVPILARAVLFDKARIFIKRVNLLGTNGVVTPYTIEDNVGYIAYIIGHTTSQNVDFSPSEAQEAFSTYNKSKLAKTLDTKMAVVANFAELLTSTADVVTVLRNDSPFGDGSICVYEKRTETIGGYQRADGSYVFARPSNGARNTKPKYALLDILNDWLGRENIIHSYKSSLFNTDFDGVDASGNFSMDCSSFVQTILQGISYNNSRFALGKDANNIYGEYVGSNNLPDSQFSPTRKHALLSYELAEYYAERGLLYNVPNDIEKAKHMLQFGDVIFGSDYEEPYVNPNRYYGITHCVLVVGISTDDDYIIIAESSNYEGTSASEDTPNHIRRAKLSTWLSNNYFRVFARPNYDYIDDVINDNIRFIPCLSIVQATGRIGTNVNNSATPNYYKVSSNSRLTYTGKVTDDQGKAYFSRVYEYDKNYNYIGTQAILSGSQAQTVALNANTRYVRFTFNYSSSVGKKMTLAHTYDFDFKENINI